jgi:16S rRNA (uracil1498-N3)-methyltransferase
MRGLRLFVPAWRREGARVDLPGEAVEHLGRVLRLGPGANLILFNGEGGEWQATIEVLDRERVCVRVGSHRLADRESPLHLTLDLRGLA